MHNRYSQVRHSHSRTTGFITRNSVLSPWACCRALRFRLYIPKPRNKFILFHFAKLLKMSKKSSSRTSRTDYQRVKAMKERDIKLTPEHPEADVKHIVRGIVRKGLKPLPPKTSISLRMDADILEWFKSQGAGYQTRINTVLRAFKDASS